MYENTDIKLK